MDVSTVMATAAVSAGVNLVVGGLIGGSVKRWMDQRDENVRALTADVKVMRENRLVGIEAAQADCKQSRKALHVEVARLDKVKVDGEQCHEKHRELLESQTEFRAAVVDLAGVQKELSATAAFVAEVNARAIAASNDIARLEGRLNAR